MQVPVEVFRGSARAGAAKYPQNVNISAAVALSGIGAPACFLFADAAGALALILDMHRGAGLDETELVIYADPTIDTHVIEVEASGAFGKFSFVEDVAISEHRKTGRIVAMAVVKTLRQLVSPLVVGH